MRIDYNVPWTDTSLMSIKKKYHNNSYSKKTKDKEYKALVNYIVPLKPVSVLEIGCGNGQNIRTLCKHLPDTNFFGIDISDVGIDYAKKNTIGNFSVCDARCLPFPDNSFDVVFSVHALEQMKYIIKEVSLEIYRVCKKNIILFEPFFVMQNIFGKWHNIRSEYVQGLEFYVEDAGFDIQLFKLLVKKDVVSKSFKHKTGVLIGKKNK